MNTIASGSMAVETVQPSKRHPEVAPLKVERLAVEVAQLWPPRGQWTEGDYFALPETSRFIELSKGELVMPPHPTHTHQLIVFELATSDESFCPETESGSRSNRSAAGAPLARQDSRAGHPLCS